MKDLWKRLVPGLAMVALLGGLTVWTWSTTTPPKAAAVQALPPPVWKPDPRLATLDQMVLSLEQETVKLNATIAQRDQRIEALQAELARLDWLLKTRATADPPKPTKASARRCSCRPRKE